MPPTCVCKKYACTQKWRGVGDDCYCHCVQRGKQRRRRWWRATPVPHHWPGDGGVTLRSTRSHATPAVVHSQAASSTAAAADRLARGPGLEPNSRRCSPAPRRAVGRQQTGTRGYFRRHECCHRRAQTPVPETHLLPRKYDEGAAYTAAAVRCTSYPPCPAT